MASAIFTQTALASLYCVHFYRGSVGGTYGQLVNIQRATRVLRRLARCGLTGTLESVVVSAAPARVERWRALRVSKTV
jgi:hypothetical protein